LVLYLSSSSRTGRPHYPTLTTQGASALFNRNKQRQRSQPAARQPHSRAPHFLLCTHALTAYPFSSTLTLSHSPSRTVSLFTLSFPATLQPHHSCTLCNSRPHTVITSQPPHRLRRTSPTTPPRAPLLPFSPQSTPPPPYLFHSAIRSAGQATPHRSHARLATHSGHRRLCLSRSARHSACLPATLAAPDIRRGTSHVHHLTAACAPLLNLAHSSTRSEHATFPFMARLQLRPGSPSAPAARSALHHHHH